MSARRRFTTPSDTAASFELEAPGEGGGSHGAGASGGVAGDSAGGRLRSRSHGLPALFRGAAAFAVLGAGSGPLPATLGPAPAAAAPRCQVLAPRDWNNRCTAAEHGLRRHMVSTSGDTQVLPGRAVSMQRLETSGEKAQGGHSALVLRCEGPSPSHSCAQSGWCGSRHESAATARPFARRQRKVPASTSAFATPRRIRQDHGDHVWAVCSHGAPVGVGGCAQPGDLCPEPRTCVPNVCCPAGLPVCV